MWYFVTVYQFTFNAVDSLLNIMLSRSLMAAINSHLFHFLFQVIRKTRRSLFWALSIVEKILISDWQSTDTGDSFIHKGASVQNASPRSTVVHFVRNKTLQTVPLHEMGLRVWSTPESFCFAKNVASHFTKDWGCYNQAPFHKRINKCILTKNTTTSTITITKCCYGNYDISEWVL